MTELQEIGTTKSRMEKFEARQRDLNDRAKYRAKVISSASSLIMCAVILVLPLLLAGVQGIKPDFSYRSISEGAIRILLFLAGKYFAAQYGATSGKADGDLLTAREEYATEKKAAYSIGTLLLTPFCAWQKTIDLESRRLAILADNDMEPDEYDATKGLTVWQTLRHFGIFRLDKFRAVCKIRALKKIRLSKELLLMDGDDISGGGVTESGSRYLNKKTFGSLHIVMVVFSCFLVVLPNFEDIATKPTLSAWVVAIITVGAVMWQMLQGYNDGAKAYNTVEVKHLQSKTHYLREYKVYVVKKLYLTHGDKYGVIIDQGGQINDQIPSERSDKETTDRGDGGGEFNEDATEDR